MKFKQILFLFLLLFVGCNTPPPLCSTDYWQPNNNTNSLSEEYRATLVVVHGDVAYIENEIKTNNLNKINTNKDSER